VDAVLVDGSSRELCGRMGDGTPAYRWNHLVEALLGTEDFRPVIGTHDCQYIIIIRKKKKEHNTRLPKLIYCIKNKDESMDVAVVESVLATAVERVSGAGHTMFGAPGVSGGSYRHGRRKIGCRDGNAPGSTNTNQ
jgi:hypothetical protein